MTGISIWLIHARSIQTMKLDRFIRLAVGLLILLVIVIAIAAMLFVTESALNVWDRLVQGPRFLLYGYFAAMTGLIVAAIWLVMRLVVRRKIRDTNSSSQPLRQSDIKQRLREAEKTGVGVEKARAELQQLAARQESGSVHLCFFGEISSGKSSLIKALVPDADVAISAVGGSTMDIRHFRWCDDKGRQILLTDVPGSGGLESKLDQVAEEEALRSQVVLFICDGDLTRAESHAVQRLLALEKPLILVMNKSDRYSREEQSMLLECLLDQLGDLGSEFANDQVVAVSGWW